MLGDRLVFGTASLGIPHYGISPRHEKNNPLKILDQVSDKGIFRFDTARGYGDAEKILGSFYERNKQIEFWTSTKIGGIDLTRGISDYIKTQLNFSLDQLQKKSIDLLYLHQNDPDIFTNKVVIETLLNYKRAGLVKEVGVSIYSFSEFDILARLNVYDWVQVPANIFDTSFLIYSQKYSNLKIAVRSVFLQGAPFVSEFKLEQSIPEAESFIRYKNELLDICSELQMDIESLMFSYIYNKHVANQIILGSRSFIMSNKLDSAILPLPAGIIEQIDSMSESPKPWSNPRLWR